MTVFVRARLLERYLRLPSPVCARYCTVQLRGEVPLMRLRRWRRLQLPPRARITCAFST